MTITKELNGADLKISLEGRLVAACSEEFKEALFEQIKEHKHILFDMSNMTHIDSSGLGALVSILQWVNTRGGIVKLACVQPRPKIVFEITKVCRVFEIYDTIEAGMASFAAQA